MYDPAAVVCLRADSGVDSSRGKLLIAPISGRKFSRTVLKQSSLKAKKQRERDQQEEELVNIFED